MEFISSNGQPYKVMDKPYWRPIETAKKDGGFILGSNGRYVMAVYWSDVWDEFAINDECLARGLTHWMELPSSPDVSPKPVTKENSHVQDQNDQG